MEQPLQLTLRAVDLTGPTGTIVVRKDAVPDDPQDFSFTAGGGLSPASFQLDDDADSTLPGTRTFADVPVGSGYSISEASVSGWEQTSATCDDGSSPSNITVSQGETVTCTFTNTKLNGYPRPKGATPLLVSLVPAYTECGSGNNTHGPPLALESCSPPAQVGDELTVGTPDANGKPAKSIGSLRMDVATGDPSTTADEADVAFRFSVTDVRKRSDLSDYTGELDAEPLLRITDRANGAGSAAGTTADFTWQIIVPCSATADDTVGSTCAITTTADTLIPGAIVEGDRAVWELGQVEIYDGGADGEAITTGDNAQFLRQGIFVP
jgi:hypothetical protein